MLGPQDNRNTRHTHTIGAWKHTAHTTHAPMSPSARSHCPTFPEPEPRPGFKVWDLGSRVSGLGLRV
eukprot:308115-Rhodomonas_salina.1